MDETNWLLVCYKYLITLPKMEYLAWSLQHCLIHCFQCNAHSWSKTMPSL